MNKFKPLKVQPHGTHIRDDQTIWKTCCRSYYWCTEQCISWPIHRLKVATSEGQALGHVGLHPTLHLI